MRQRLIPATYGTRAAIRTSRATVQVRVRDKAGNWSRPRAVPVR